VRRNIGFAATWAKLGAQGEDGAEVITEDEINEALQPFLEPMVPLVNLWLSRELSPKVLQMSQSDIMCIMHEAIEVRGLSPQSILIAPLLTSLPRPS
jgi:hypothetical protein